MKRKEGTPKRPSSRSKTIYLVGEMTGETISKIARASLAQFSREKVKVKTFFQVRDKQQIRDIAKKAAQDKALVAFSVIRPPLRDFLIQEAERRGIKAIDVIGDFIVQLSIFLKEKPMAIPGRQYILDEDYYRRIEGINFAVKHDDGKMPQGLKLADLVLVGLSRTGKTPLSTYLANQGWKVANVPLHPDMAAPEELFQVDQRKVFGLIISVENLVKLREGRLKQLGLAPYAKYADPVMIADEIEWCKAFFQQNPRWRILDISDKAIEEAAASILRAYQTGKKPV
ncbi:MAG: kinase/pyrophosphorylase [Deltaproteobacteria bacterium]|nr:kinase/pyrophosphorylase [Deltaproteobacteria bacterium]MBW2074348.1 kinase/pyrophosphorylase [Deltaproteobacteria bacterium]